MLEKITKVAVLCASIGVIVIAIEISILLIPYYRNGLSPLPNPVSNVQNQLTPRVGPYPGMKVSLPGVEWEKSGRTMLFVLSSSCGFCNASTDFYQKAVQEKQHVRDIRFVAVFPGDVKEAEQYLKDKGIGIQDVVQAMPNTVGASGFPTLMLLDKTGTIKKAWTGKLTAERELEVLDSIKCTNCG